MRRTCFNCVIKHLGQAAVIQGELRDYPNFRIYVIGHLAEAAAECLRDHPALYNVIRSWRIIFEENDRAEIPYEDLYEYISTCCGMYDKSVTTNSVDDNSYMKPEKITKEFPCCEHLMPTDIYSR